MGFVSRFSFPFLYCWRKKLHKRRKYLKLFDGFYLNNVYKSDKEIRIFLIFNRFTRFQLKDMHENKSGCKWREQFALSKFMCDEKRRKCARIFHGFRFTFSYLLRCELNEFLQLTANVSHQLHSTACRRERESEFTLFCNGTIARLLDVRNVTLKYDFVVMENVFSLLLRWVLRAMCNVSVERCLKDMTLVRKHISNNKKNWWF